MYYEGLVVGFLSGSTLLSALHSGTWQDIAMELPTANLRETCSLGSNGKVAPR